MKRTKNDKPAPPPRPSASAEVVSEVAAGFNAFGLQLYREVAQAPGDQIISPASVALALAMTHAGARGTTASEMGKALHITQPLPDAQAAVATVMLDWAGRRDEVEVRVANRLFGDRGVAFDPGYLDLTGRFFGARLDLEDFRGAHEPARQRINAWVEDITRERIRDLLPSGSVDASTRLVLVNAIYFKASWMTPFPQRLTAPAPFHAAKGKHDVPTMNVTTSMRVTSDAAAPVQVVELPYLDPQFAMTIVMPTAADGLAALEASLGPDSLAGWQDGLAQQRVALSLPKFRIAPDGLRLAEILGRLGIKAVFSSEADLTGIAPASEQLQLAEAYHKGFIEVDERGTEAAAATALVARAGGMPPSSEPRVLKIDRPFLFLVRDTKSGMLLFMGRVQDPTTAS